MKIPDSHTATNEHYSILINTNALYKTIAIGRSIVEDDPFWMETRSKIMILLIDNLSKSRQVITFIFIMIHKITHNSARDIFILDQFGRFLFKRFIRSN